MKIEIAPEKLTTGLTYVVMFADISCKEINWLFEYGTSVTFDFKNKLLYIINYF